MTLAAYSSNPMTREKIARVVCGVCRRPWRQCWRPGQRSLPRASARLRREGNVTPLLSPARVVSCKGEVSCDEPITGGHTLLLSPPDAIFGFACIHWVNFNPNEA